MFWKKMVNFCKNANCPSSPDLLAFQSDEVSLRKNREIAGISKPANFARRKSSFTALPANRRKKLKRLKYPSRCMNLPARCLAINAAIF
jgi:hypothetical protein